MPTIQAAEQKDLMNETDADIGFGRAKQSEGRRAADNVGSSSIVTDSRNYIDTDICDEMRGVNRDSSHEQHADD